MGKLSEKYSIIDTIIKPRMIRGWALNDPKKPDEKRSHKFTKDQIRDYERRVERSESLLFHVELIQSLNIKNKGYKDKIQKLANENKLLKDRLEKLEKQQI